MKSPQPIKRNKALQPLSREHHDGLLFVWKLRQGLANHTPVATLQAFCQWFWKSHIKNHFYMEEKVLMTFLPPGDAMAARMKREHDNIREMIISIDNDVDENTIGSLANFIEQHIRFEERELFRHAENMLSPEQLLEMGSLLAKVNHTYLHGQMNSG